MKTSSFIALFAVATFSLAAAFAPSAHAQTAAAPAPAQNPVAAPNEIIYTATLPTAAELTQSAAAQKLTIASIRQTSADITVVYQYANGQTNTVSYQPLPSNQTPGTVAIAAPATTTTTVVYQDPYYAAYPRYDYYPYPWGWYAPVGIRLGFGFGFHGGGFHGGHGRWR